LDIDVGHQGAIILMVCGIWRLSGLDMTGRLMQVLMDTNKARSFGSSRKFGAKPEPLQEIYLPEFYPPEYLIFLPEDDMAIFCNFFNLDEDFHLEAPSACLNAWHRS
jgi:hypothetical protein